MWLLHAFFSRQHPVPGFTPSWRCLPVHTLHGCVVKESLGIERCTGSSAHKVRGAEAHLRKRPCGGLACCGLLNLLQHFKPNCRAENAAQSAGTSSSGLLASNSPADGNGAAVSGAPEGKCSEATESPIGTYSWIGFHPPSCPACLPLQVPCTTCYAKLRQCPITHIS